MDEVTLEARLAELEQLFGGDGPSVTTRDASGSPRLDRLRLRVKYLLFDLEATRRENRLLRQLLETEPR